MSAVTEPVLWSAATVAAILRVDQRTVLRRADAGWFDAGTVVRLGAYRMYRADLMERQFPRLVAEWRERVTA
jgi:hypothetical protein